MSSIIYNPLLDANLSAAPAAVYLVSPNANTQAQATLSTTDGNIAVKAKQWGLMGNKTSLRVAVNAQRGGWDALVRNNGIQEAIRVPAEASPLTLRYVNPTTVPDPVTYPVKGFGTWGTSTCTVNLSAGEAAAGTLRLAFTRNIAVDAAMVGTQNAWEPMGPVVGPVTVVGSGATVAGGTVTVTVTGVNSDTGIAVSDLLEFNSSNISTAQTTAISFASVEYVRVELGAGASISGGNLVVSGKCFDDMNEANGQKFVSDVIKLIQPYADKGFLVSTASSRVSSIQLSDLDKQAAVDIVAQARSLSLQGWKLVTTINNASKLVELTRGNTGNLDTITALAPFFKVLAGGTEPALPDATDWSSALDQLVWYNIDTVSAFYDPTGTPAADDSILAQFTDHIDRMWSDGANERTLWLGAGHEEGIDALVQRAAAFNSERVNVVVDSAEIELPTGGSELLRPYWYALMLAAADASLLNVETLTRARPRVLGISRGDANDDLLSQQDVNELIRGGLIVSTTPPGGATRIEREVTTWTADDNPARTEAICTRSVRASTKAMRASLDSLLRPGAGVLVLADVKAQVEQELDRQARSVSPLITNYDARSIKIVDSADRYEVAYNISVRINKNFITLNVGVTVPVGTI
jgi:hypothetical protein